MDVLGVGMGEVLMILALSMIIFGPERMVEIGRKIGKTVRTLKKISSDLTAQVMNELEPDEKDHRPKPEKKTE